jgi:O-antigen biosynthesis protein WbqP
MNTQNQNLLSCAKVSMSKRLMDVTLSLSLLVCFSLPLLLVALIVKFTSSGPVLHWSDRVGVDNGIFRMPKFRTMHVSTPAIATHLLKNPEVYVSPAGSFLRRMSLDELPQLWSILKGDMTFIGPRPALYNQDDLIELRTEKGIHRLVPGITGWAQINGRDDLPIPVKVAYDEYYLTNRSLLLDLKICIKTFIKILRKEGVQH